VLGVAILLTAARGNGQEPKPLKKKRAKAAAQTLPAGSPPSFMLVAKVDTDARQLTMLYRVAVPVTATREVEVEIDGKRVRQTEAFTMLRDEDRMQLLSWDAIVATAGGKALDDDDAWKALRGQIVVVTSGEKLDPAYARLLGKETVVIETKPAKPRP
jgi:hypothetical protein